MELNNTLRAALAILLAAPTLAIAGNDTLCGRDPRTDAMICVRSGELRETDGIRHAPLWKGGPQGVRKTPYFVHFNCSTNVVHLKDRDGVSFGGGQSTDTEQLKQLTSSACSETLRRSSKR